MNRIICALVLASSCGVLDAQNSALTVSPSAENYTIRSPRIFPGWRYQYPEKRIISVQIPAGQGWTASISGTLASACLYQTTCFALTEEYSAQPLTSGTGPARVAVTWYGQQPPDLGTGSYGATITFTPTGSGNASTVAVNLQVLDATTLPATSEVKATSMVQNGCVTPDALFGFTFAVQCTIPNEAPEVSPVVTQPPVGGYATDPSFGGVIHRITGPGCFTEYGTTTAFSVNSTYVLTSCGVFRTADASLVSNTYVALDYAFMSAVDDEVYLYLSGSQVRSRNFVTGQDTLLGDYGGAPYNFTTLYGGGTANASEDEWISFFEYSSPPFPKLCAVNVPALRAAGAPGPSNTYCAVYQGIQPLTFLDWAGVSEVDRPTGKRFVFLSSIPVSTMFSVGPSGSGNLIQEYILPEWPGWVKNNDDGVCQPTEVCLNASNFTHNALYLDRDGQVNMFARYDDILLVRDYVATYRLNAGLNIFRLPEEGGGLRILGQNLPDYQPGCSSRISACTVAAQDLPGDRYAALVTNAEIASDRTRLTLNLASSWSPASTHPVIVQNGTGNWACLNGNWTATVTSATQVEIPAVCQTGSGSYAQVLMGDASNLVTDPSMLDNVGQLQIWRPERQVHRVAMHRSVEWNTIPGTGVSDYFATPRASISRDGRYIAFNSNWGALDFQGASVYVVGTGLGDPQNEIVLKRVTPGQNTAVVEWELPNAQACTFEVSADPTFHTLVETFVDPAGSWSRQTYLGQTTALTPDSNYWMRMQCGLEVESAIFRTRPAAAGVSMVNTVLGPVDNVAVTSAVVQYRAAGSSDFTSTAIQPCAAGCEVAWQGQSGAAVQYRVVYLDASGNPTFTGDTITTVFP